MSAFSALAGKSDMELVTTKGRSSRSLSFQEIINISNYKDHPFGWSFFALHSP